MRVPSSAEPSIKLNAINPLNDKRIKTMSMKDAYERKLQAQLDEWDAEIGKLRAKADKAEASVQLEYYKQIEDLRQQQQEAQVKLNELRHSTENAWEDMKAGVENAWNSLGEAVKSATARFK